MESIYLFIDHWTTLLVYHLAIGLVFAAIALAINHYMPYSFTSNPKDVMYRKFVFYGILIVVFIASFLADSFYILGSIVDELSLSTARAERALAELQSTKILSGLISLIVYAGTYFGMAYYLKDQHKLLKCYSVFKFK